MHHIIECIIKFVQKFFRRAVREGGRYTCKAGGLCDINTRTRNACRYCRYRKCLDIGMSLKGTIG